VSVTQRLDETLAVHRLAGTQGIKNITRQPVSFKERRARDMKDVVPIRDLNLVKVRINN